MKILLLHDDATLAGILAARLEEQRHQVIYRKRVAHLTAMVEAADIDLVILDEGLLSNAQLLDTCRAIREETSAGVLLLTRAEPGAIERQRLLDAGADDYHPIPIRLTRLVDQIRAIRHRRSLTGGPGRRPYVPITEALLFDRDGQRLVGKGGGIDLTRKEYRLLSYLVRRAGAVVGREELLAAVWYRRRDPLPHEVDVYISYLRKKLEPDPARPRHLVTVRGRGYRFDLPPADEGMPQPRRQAYSA